MKTVSSILFGVPPLFTDLAKLLAGEIDCSQETLTKYSLDGSPYFVRPQAVIYPKNTTDLKHVIAFGREFMIPITVRGKGSAKTGGSLSEGIVIDMTRYFTNIKQLNMLNQTVTVDTGVTVKELKYRLKSWKRDIPFLSSQDNDSTIGSIIANKRSTPSSFCHGSIREWIEALTVVVDSGEEHHLSDGITPSGRLLGIYQSVFPIILEESATLRAAKPAHHDDGTGYNAWSTSIGPRQLIDELIGSEGTLGIITSVTFRLAPQKEHIFTTYIPIDNEELLTSCIEIAKHHQADQIFLYDKAYSNLIAKYRPHILKKPSKTPYTLLVSHSKETSESLHDTLRHFIKALPIHEDNLTPLTGTTFIDTITDKTLFFSLIEEYTQGYLTPITVADGLIVPLSKYHDTVAFLENYLGSLGKLYVLTGNAGSGHISAVTLFDHTSPSYHKDLDAYTKTIYSYIQKTKGGISAKGGEGLSKTPYINYIFNEATMNAFTRIKKAWDPLLIFNPGKKLSITTSYLREHTKH